MKILCATGNNIKFATGRDALAEHGIELVQYPIDIDEIQGYDPEKIVIAKAKSAYEIIGKPLVVSDDCWRIHALNGFPGPYMKDVSHWLTADDFLRLLEGVEDRSVTLTQNLAFINESGEVTTFYKDVEGHVIDEARGPSDKAAWTQICVIDGHSKKTIAESEAEHIQGAWKDSSAAEVWHIFAKWLKEQS